MARNIDNISKTITNYIERNSLFQENPPWEIRKSELGGFGVFARRSIETGEVIFKDHPIILGPRAVQTCPIICVNCYKKENLKPCTKLCGLLVCSVFCQNSKNHQIECKIIRQWQTEPICGQSSEKLTKVLTPIRSLLLSDEDKAVVKCLKAHDSPQHGFEVNIMKNILKLNLKEDEELFMRFVCSVMDSNAFEVILGDEEKQASVRGLYPLGSLMNHSCTPKTYHVFDKNQRMVVRASSFIPAGSELFHSYSRLIWGTPARRYHLFRTKHFLCKCERCEDPTEFGTYLSGLLCRNCKVGKVVPLDVKKWQCEDCGDIMEMMDIASITSLLGSTLNTLKTMELEVILCLIEEKLPKIVPKNNESIVELKYRTIWIIGHEEGFKWAELPDTLIHRKINYCKDLLVILENLHLGKFKIRGLLLYELVLCLRELEKRKTDWKIKGCDNQVKNLLLEGADIMMYDVGAPLEIKNLWSKEIKDI